MCAASTLASIGTAKGIDGEMVPVQMYLQRGWCSKTAPGQLYPTDIAAGSSNVKMEGSLSDSHFYRIYKRLD
jgi:hypothetical protein